MTDNGAAAPVKLSLPLAFQQDIFHQLRGEDTLLIIAAGLGLLRIVTNLLHAYDVAGSNLILVLGATEQENAWIGEFLAEQAVVSGAVNARGLNVVNTQMASVTARQKLYARGGIISVTGQIAILDLLAGVLQPETLTGIMVLHAERVVATSVEAFILRNYRQSNKEGFLKAFSEEPERFASGFSPLATAMRNLFLRTPSLYPRFQVDVVKSLEGKRKAEVIELEVPMTESMETIQTAIMECVESSIGELKKAATGIDMTEWNADTALHVNFYVRVMSQLKPEWHRLHPRTKQVANDLLVLHSMLSYLLSLDAVQFLQHLDSVLAVSQPRSSFNKLNMSPWLLMDAASTIFETAKQRVYSGKMGNASTKISEDTLKPVLEELPKWAVLQEVLDEIEKDAYFNPIRDDSTGTILIMCSDLGICAQIREFLQTMQIVRDEEEDEDDDSVSASAASMMKRRLRSYINRKREFDKIREHLFSEQKKGPESRPGQMVSDRGKPPPNKRRRMRGAAAVASGPGRSDVARTAGDKDAHFANLMSEIGLDGDSEFKGEIGADPLQNMEQYYELHDMNDLVIVHPYEGDLDEHVLEEVKPRYVIMYEPSPAFIRRIEVYRSSHTDRNIRVYFMYYKNSVEEQRYLSAVRKEKDAFTRLIRERATMSLTIDHSKLDPEEAFLRTINTRIAGGGRITATAVKPRVVVDTREFRSSLPGLVNARGTEIIPCMLTVGDYVLTPDIAVERKSISDLISSLNNGRLFNQAETMTAHYKSPMLLIEFDQSKSFTLEPFADLSSASNAFAAAPDLQSKLVLLTLAFPNLRIIWSSSPYQTAEIFAELKRNSPEPDPSMAVSIGLAEGEQAGIMGHAYNQTAMDMLREIPGVDEKVAIQIALKVENVWALANTSEAELAKIVGRENGRLIWRFFNRRAAEE
jgi:DNA excision repair protein ERCC-4